jgi:hypothetical protein
MLKKKERFVLYTQQTSETTMTAFNFLTARSIIFGSGKLAEVPGLIKTLGPERCSVLLVVDARPGAADPITKLLVEAGVVSKTTVALQMVFMLTF